MFRLLLFGRIIIIMSERREEVRLGGRGGSGSGIFGGLDDHSIFRSVPGVLGATGSSCPRPDSSTACDWTGGGGGGISPMTEHASVLSKWSVLPIDAAAGVNGKTAGILAALLLLIIDDCGATFGSGEVKFFIALYLVSMLANSDGKRWISLST